MKMYLRTLLAAVLCGALFIGAAYAREVPTSFADMVEPVIPAVVNISTTQKIKTPQMGPMGAQIPGLEDDPQLAPFRELFKQFNGGQLPQQPPREQKVTSLGSGFVIDPDGYIVTNNHVIGDATDVTVTFHDDSKLSGKIVGKDPKTDLALIKVKPVKPLPFVKFGNSDAMRVGDWVVAVGNPFGLGGSVSAGIVSARGRNINAGAYDDFIQTDAAINRGNSGGPLFNMNGEVVGINAAIYSPTGTNIGIGFAVPTSLAQPVIEQLRKTGHITRGWLGVKIQEVNDEIANSLGLKDQKGALVLDITKDGPAAKSGLEVGDVILSFDGKEVNAMHSLPRMVADTAVGKKVDVTVWRKGGTKNVGVALGKLPDDVDNVGDANKPDAQAPGDDAQTGGGQQVLGLIVKPLTRSLKQQFNINGTVSGLLVTGVDDDSDAASKGLREGDVIVEANQHALDTVDVFKDAVKEAKKEGRAFVLLRVVRGKDAVFVTLPVK